MLSLQQRRHRLEELLERVQKNRQSLEPTADRKGSARVDSFEEEPGRGEEPAEHEISSFQPAERTQFSTRAVTPPEELGAKALEEADIPTADISEVQAEVPSEEPRPEAEEIVEEISEEDVEFVDEEAEPAASMELLDEMQRQTDDEPTRVVHTSSILPPKAHEQGRADEAAQAAPPVDVSAAKVSQAPPAADFPQEAPRVFAPEPGAGGDVARVEGELRPKSYTLDAVLERAWKYGTNL